MSHKESSVDILQ